MKKKKAPVVAADPARWSEKSKQSLVFQFGWRKEYQDSRYTCLNCRKAAIFSAEDQKYTYETRKAYIDQRRNLCEACWRQSCACAADIKLRQEQWAESKLSLAKEAGFLTSWLQLLMSSEKFGIRANHATKAMLRKLLAKIEVPERQDM